MTIVWPTTFVLYSKPGCHLCESLEEKLHQIPEMVGKVEIRDIRSESEWWERYQFEIPVLTWIEGDREHRLPAFSPRASITQIRSQIEKHLLQSQTKDPESA